MPTVNVYKKDLENLTNMCLTDRIILEKFPMMGVEVEDIWEEDTDGKKEKIIQFSVNPNRPDYLSAEGLARGFRGFLNIDKGLPKINIYESDVIVYVENPKIRPYCAFAVVKNINIDDYVLDSIINLQEKLHWTLGRDRKKIAIGIHDLDKVNPPFYYKDISDKDIKFIPLNSNESMSPKEILEKHEKGIKYSHLIPEGDSYPIIVDKNNNVLSMPPIINGELTKVTTETKNLFIDITGTDENLVNYALNIIIYALNDRRGTIHKVKVIRDGKEYLNPDLKIENYEVNVENINKRLGLNLNVGEMIECLRRGRMDCDYNYDKKCIVAKVPPYRTDILNEVDFAEEVAINYGYDRFLGNLPEVFTVGERHKIEKKLNAIRNIMIGFNFYEVMNLTLSNEEILFKKMNIDFNEKDYVEVLKPASIEHRVVRPTLLPLLLETFRINKHNELPQRIFEVGDCVIIDEKDDDTYTKCKNIEKLSFAIIHPTANFNEVKSYAEGLLRELNIEYTLENYDHPSFIRGRCAKIVNNKNNEVIGYFGEIHPEVILNFELEHPVVGFEMKI